MKPVEKPADVVRRPGFPLRMPSSAGQPKAIKVIAVRAGELAVNSLSHSNKEVCMPVSNAVYTAKGIGLDSQAVRARMVQ